MSWIGSVVRALGALLPRSPSAMPPVESKRNQIVLITGASRGIGLATAIYLAQKGHVVYAMARSRPSDAHTYASNLRFDEVDVCDPIAIKQLIDRILRKEGRLDVLINNAAYALAGPIECLNMERVERQMDVNFHGAIRMCQAVLPQMRKQRRGHIINVSSTQGVYGLPFGSLLSASKAALESLSEALSVEVAPWSIAVSIVQPGMVATDFTVALGFADGQEAPYLDGWEIVAKSLGEKRTPSKECQTPEEVAEFLHRIIQAPRPQLRYQTSKTARYEVALWIKDLTGCKYARRMRACFASIPTIRTAREPHQM